MEDPELNAYFDAYGDLSVHKTMLTDKVRIDAYYEAIFRNRDRIKDKIVMDVGAGTGILSIFCAKAGAKKVYAVEACHKLIPLLQDVVKANAVENIVEVIYGEVETIEVQDNVDVLVSEWMGHYLLHESMIESLINARRFLSSNSLILPHKATIYVALCDLPQLTSQWTEVRQVNLEAVTGVYRKAATCFPHLEHISYEALMSLPKPFCAFDLETVSPEAIESNVMRTVMVTNKTGTVEGICIWWDVEFPSNIVLSTSPFSMETHWKQTVILFPKPLLVTCGIPIAIELTITKTNQRVFTLSLMVHDAEGEVHDIPCSCYMDKCQVANAYFMKTSVQIKEEPPSPPSE
uniref:Protein arginine n-methyltransferase prmt1 n=1 Tax=Triatoma dimidiata TaxID=72491 RepID=A0A0V0G9T3_TRIDM